MGNANTYLERAPHPSCCHGRRRPVANDHFGSAVAISGTRILVGAPEDDTGAADSGSIYLYDLTSPTPSTPVAVLSNPTPASTERFGTAVAMDGTAFLSGAPGEDGATVDRGAAYFYGPTNDIRVHDGASTAAPQLVDGQSMSVPFATPVGFPSQRSFTIANAGPDPLQISAITAPAGYTVLNRPASLAAGAFATFHVRLNAAETGNFNGSVVVVSDDPDERSFEFPVSGVVAPYVAGALWNAGFEIQEAIGGYAMSTLADWSDRTGAIVTAENGIAPAEGSRMLKFVSTQPGNPATETWCWIGQLVDVSHLRTLIDAGLVQVSFSARFNRVAGNAQTDTDMYVWVGANSGPPADYGLFVNGLDYREVGITTDSDPETWQQQSITNFILPAGTTYLDVYVEAEENVFNNTSGAEFDGHYADDLVLTINTVDTVAPVLDPHANIGPVEATSAAGATVSYDPASATDNSGTAPVITYSRDSGATFPIGVTTVTITARDAAGNTSTSSFAITVQDTTAPTLSSVPANITTEATGPAGAFVTYPAPAASDAVSGSVMVTCHPQSGSLFGQGTHTVRCTATDGAGNTAGAEFTITITLTDTDSDGMPDAWETANGLDPAEASDAATDPDGDAATNRDEYLAGTDAGDRTSVFRLTFDDSQPTAVVRFTAQPGRSYAVQMSEDLGAWESVLLVPSAPDHRLIEFPVPTPALTRRFCRARTPAPAP